MNAESLLTRVKRGERLTPHELNWVRQSLVERMSDEDKYTLIHVLWKSRDRESEDLIRAHLTDGDEMVRRIALQTLADLFPRDDIFDLAVASLHDPSAYVRMIAASAVGTLGATLVSRAGEAAAVLLQRFERSHIDDDPERVAYYDGLLNLMEIPWNIRPLPTRPLRAKDIDTAVIAAARELATRSKDRE